MNKLNILFTIPLSMCRQARHAHTISACSSSLKIQTKHTIFLLSCFAKRLRQQNCQVLSDNCVQLSA